MTLTTEHREYLAARGITDPAIIEARGYTSVDEGLRIPILGLTEEAEIGFEIRKDKVAEGERKFTRPAGQGNRLNVPPSARDAVRNVGEPLWVVEGATRADALAQRGVAATSLTGVWGFVNKDDGTLSDFRDFPWQGRTVYFGPDADAWTSAKVNKATHEFIKFAQRKGAKPYVLRLPEGMGIDDYLAAGNSAMSLLSLAVPAKDVPVVTEQKKSKHTAADTDDLSLAERWASEKPNAKYLIDTSEWVVFEGKKWANDTKSKALTRQSINETLRTVVSEVYSNAEDPNENAVAASIKSDLFSSSKPSRVASQAETLSSIQSADHRFESDPYLLNLNNGVLDLRTETLHDHNPKFLQRGIAEVNWLPTATAPKWQEFLDEILPSEVQEYIQCFFGSSLMNAPAEQILPIFQGAGANGKSVLLGTIQGVLGSEYTTPIDKKLLIAGKKEDHQTNLMALRGKRLVTASETDAGDKLSLASVKQLTGGDLITARGIGKDQTSFKPTHNLVMLTNARPQIDGADKAIWRRLRIVPFTTIIDEAKQDRGLERRLLEEESEGILRWLVEGFAKWWANDRQLPDCHTVNMATLSYQMDENSFAAFADERLIRDPKVKTPKSDISAAWQEWKARNWDAKDMNAREFNDAMRNLGYGDGQARIGERKAKVWVGVRLITNSEDNEDRNHGGTTGERLQDQHISLSPAKGPVGTIGTRVSEVVTKPLDTKLGTNPDTAIENVVPTVPLVPASPRQRFWDGDLAIESPMLPKLAELLTQYAMPITHDNLLTLERVEQHDTPRWDEQRETIMGHFTVTLLDLFESSKDIEHLPRHPDSLYQMIMNFRTWLDDHGLIVRVRRTDGALDKWRQGDAKVMTNDNTAFLILKKEN